VSQASWRKSSYSNGEGSSCVEVAWQKSSYSNDEGTSCVEVACQGHQVLVRDSKNPTGPILTITPTAWRELVVTVP
jgi:hypothetical protein